MKTAMQQMIEEIDNQQKRYIDLAKKDKKLSKGVDAILTATTLLKMKAKELLEAEKEQIIDASVQANLRYDTGANEPVLLRYCNDAEQYYQITFKSD